MTSSIKAPDRHPTAVSAEIERERLHVSFADGRDLYVPLTWFDWLANANEGQQVDFEIIEGGEGIWWEQLDDGVSVPGLLGLPHS
jgi:uncharacterized protein DUF2442